MLHLTVPADDRTCARIAYHLTSSDICDITTELTIRSVIVIAGGVLSQKQIHATGIGPSGYAALSLHESSNTNVMMARTSTSTTGCMPASWT